MAKSSKEKESEECMTITDKLAAALEFDESTSIAAALVRSDAFAGATEITFQVEAARYEQSRLAPLHLALIDCVEALEEIHFDPSGLSAQFTSFEALERLAEVLK